MIRELDTVVLAHSIPQHSLAAGDIGAVVHVYKNHAAYEVEFIAGEGETIAVLTLEPSDIRVMRRREILHAREFAFA